MIKMKKKKWNSIKGLSLISLVITIIVIIILTAILFSGSFNSIDMAGYGKFSSEFSDFRQAVQTKHLNIKGDYSVKNIQKNDKDVYYEMATGIKNTKAIPSGYIEYLNIDVFPTSLQGEEYYEITNKKLLKELYQNAPKEQTFYITDVGECFMLPGYLYDKNDKMYMYLNEKSYYINDGTKSITVTFDTDGGKVIPDKKIVKNNHKYNSLPIPTKEGYTFNGWYTKKDGGELITSESVVNMAENHTLYAQWLISDCIVEFNVNGGNSTFSTKTVKYNEEYGTLPTPMRTDYIFKGWYTSLVGGDLITSSSIVKTIGKHTLYAQWISSEQTVTFDANGGNVTPQSKVVKYNEAYGSLPTPTMLGYTFKGWYTEKAGGEEITRGSIVKIESDQTLYAIWTLKEFIITFDANSGTVTSDRKIVKYKETYGDLPEPTRVGYTFKGWYTGKTDGKEITSDNIVTTTENQTIYAQWTPKEYTITLDGNGGNVTSSSIVVKYNETYGNLPEPTRTGYDFNGWYTGKTNGTQITDNSIVNVAENQTIYAQWIPKEYTMTLDGNGGSVTPSSIVVKYDNPYEKLPTPTRTGYDFNGWYTGKTNGTQITDNSIVNVAENQTLYAQWMPKEYTITLDSNGGNVTLSSIVVKYDNPYEKLPTPTRTGYDFKGWYTEKTNGTQITNSSIVKTTENQTLYAKWTSKEYTINFDANGGIGLTTSKVVKYDGTYDDLPTPTRTGYTFDGWYTTKDGGSLIENSTKVTITTDTTLYAHWKCNIIAKADSWFKGKTVGRADITSITFKSSYTPTGTVTEQWSADAENSGSIMCYVEGTDLIITGTGEKNIYANEDSSYMFSGRSSYEEKNRYFSALTTINGLEILDTSRATNMYKMFNFCSSLTTLDVSKFDTSKVTDMRNMFSSSRSLTTLDVSKFNTSNVTNMTGMFGECSKLIELDISNFDLSNLSNMTNMFISNSNLITVKLPQDTTAHKLTTMMGAFMDCTKLTEVDMSGIKISEALTNMRNIFTNCHSITEIKFSTEFNTSGVTDMGSLFYGCRKLTSLDLSMFDTRKVINFTYKSTTEPYELRGMFKNCSKLETIYVSDKFTVEQATDPELGSTDMFLNCTSLKGGNNTVYDSNYVDKIYARIDGKDYDGDGVVEKGYFTEK